MKKGIVTISKFIIQESLGFPPDWNIEEMTLNKQGDTFTAVISGSDFPEVVPAKECQLIYHKEALRVEVREVT